MDTQKKTQMIPRFQAGQVWENDGHRFRVVSAVYVSAEAPLPGGEHARVYDRIRVAIQSEGQDWVREYELYPHAVPAFIGDPATGQYAQLVEGPEAPWQVEPGVTLIAELAMPEGRRLLRESLRLLDRAGGDFRDEGLRRLAAMLQEELNIYLGVGQ